MSYLDGYWGRQAIPESVYILRALRNKERETLQAVLDRLQRKDKSSRRIILVKTSESVLY